MSKTIQIALLVVFSSLLISGCSSDKKKTKQQQNGNVVFFHNIENTGELQLKATNTNLRNSYGTVDFQQFGSMIYLPAQSWGLKVVDDKSTNAVIDDVTLLESSFTVPANSVGLIALTGTYVSGTPDVTMHQLALATDTETSSSNAAYIQFINVSHLHKDVAAVDVYIISDGETNAGDSSQLSTFTPAISNLVFGGTSATIRLENLSQDYYVYAVETGNPANVLYESGRRELKDYRNQTLLLSPNYNSSANSDISIFYYSTVADEHWNDIADWKAEIRVFNAFEAGLDFEASDGATATQLASALAEGNLSAFTELDSDELTYFIKAIAGSGDLAPQLPLYLTAGEQWTVIFYGDSASTPPALRAMKAKEEQALIPTRAGITVSNASYFASTDTLKRFDVHILRQGQAFNTASPVFSATTPGSYSSKRYAQGQYQIFIVENGTQNVYASTHKTLNNNENYHFVIVGNDAAGFRICQIDNAASTCDGY